MSFQDDLIATLSRSGVTLAVGAAPSRESLTAGLAKLNDFVDSLDSDTAAALEDVTTNFPVKAILSDPAVNIAPELGSVLTAFDQANARFSIADVADILKQPLVGPGSTVPTRPGAPRIDTIQPEQFTLHDPNSNLFVAWSIAEPSDVFHFMWTDKVPVPSFAASWNAIEFKTNNPTGSFATRISNTSIGKKYTFKVQGCKSMDIGSDVCGPYCADMDIQIPGNTHSLRTFLKLSGVPLGAGVRSLGAAVFGAGLRAMMRL